MAKVRYIRTPGDAEPHEQFGITWGAEAVDIKDSKLIAKLKGMPAYEVDGARYSPKASADAEPDKAGK